MFVGIYNHFFYLDIFLHFFWCVLRDFFVICRVKEEKEESKHWTYEDTISWGDDYSECSGDSQSPINIMEDDIIKNQAIGPIKFTGYRKVQQFDMINNGHSLQLNFKNEDSFIWGGNLPDKYTALQFHFHWDAENERSGSEHQINGIAYPLEMHIVHVKSSSLNIGDALKDPSGLAVLSFLFQIDDKENPEMEKFLQSISKTKDFKEEKDISLNIAELIGLDELGPYYRYKGSLTTPPCSEVVIWSVYKKPITISKRQLQVFWSLKSKKKYLHNFRPTQKMNGRDVCVSVQ